MSNWRAKSLFLFKKGNEEEDGETHEDEQDMKHRETWDKKKNIGEKQQISLPTDLIKEKTGQATKLTRRHRSIKENKQIQVSEDREVCKHIAFFWSNKMNSNEADKTRDIFFDKEIYLILIT